MTVQTSKKDLRQIAHLALTSIKDFKRYGLITQTTIDEGNENRHLLFIEFNPNWPPFKWIENNDICESCERQHEGRGSIINCFLFNEWTEFAKNTGIELSKNYGVEVKVELQGRNSDLSLMVQVFQ